MLNAFQQQLRILARDEDGGFEKRIKERWKKPLPKSLVSDLKEFVTLLPEIERRVFDLYVWLTMDSKVKNIGSHFLTYMYQAHDFLPESEANGLFGYLDDAYLAALFYELMIEEIEASGEIEVKKNDRDFCAKVIKLKRKAKAVIPDEAIQIKLMVSELFEGDESSFDQLFQGKLTA